MDHSLPGFLAHGVSQARILEWVAISFFRGYSQPRDLIQVSCPTSGFFTTELLGESLEEETGNTLWYSCLKNFMDRGAWQATVRGHKALDTTEQLITRARLNEVIMRSHNLRNLIGQMSFQEKEETPRALTHTHTHRYIQEKDM